MQVLLIKNKFQFLFYFLLPSFTQVTKRTKKREKKMYELEKLCKIIKFLFFYALGRPYDGTQKEDIPMQGRA